MLLKEEKSISNFSESLGVYLQYFKDKTRESKTDFALVKNPVVSLVFEI